MRHNTASFATVTALIGAFTLSACGPEIEADARFSSSSALGDDLCPRPDDAVCVTDEHQLIAGQNIDAGAVRIDNDGTNLLIQIIAEGGWKITEVHIFAGTGSAPMNKKGTVVPGQFPFNTTYSAPVTVHTLSVPLASLNVGCGDTLNTVVHAVVRRTTAGGGSQVETAFGDGTPLLTTRWGYSSTRTICCEPPPPPPPPPEVCPEVDCVEPVGFWAANTSTWPGTNASWVICWSGTTGPVSLATAVNTTGSSPAFDALVDEIAAAANNQDVGCADRDSCAVDPAFQAGIAIVNDCLVDASESARAQEITALLRSFNDGSYDYGVCF